MHCAKAVLILVFAAASCGADFSGESAMAFARKAVSFGPRPPASAGIQKMQAWLIAELRKFKCQVIEDNFRGDTPLGRTPMKNIIARFPGSSGRAG